MLGETSCIEHSRAASVDAMGTKVASPTLAELLAVDPPNSRVSASVCTAKVDVRADVSPVGLGVDVPVDASAVGLGVHVSSGVSLATFRALGIDNTVNFGQAASLSSSSATTADSTGTLPSVSAAVSSIADTVLNLKAIAFGEDATVGHTVKLSRRVAAARPPPPQDRWLPLVAPH